MFDRLGAAVSRRAIWVLLAWAVLAGLVVGLAPRWDDVTRDGDFAYLPEAMSSVQGERLLEAAFPHVLSKSQLILVVARRDGPLEDQDIAVADELVEEFSLNLSGDWPIVGILSHQTEVVGEKLKSPAGPNGQAILIILQLSTEFMAIGNMDLLRQAQERLDQVRGRADVPAGLELGMTGSAAIGADMLFSAEESIRNTERTTLLLVVLILILVYRAPGLVVVPVITILVSLAVAMGMVAWLAQFSADTGWLDFKIFKTTRIFVVVILFGAGTDFCLFLIARYKEELGRGLQPVRAMEHALARVGGAIAASAMTTVLGLGAMAFADFGKFRNSGPAIALCLLVALGACVTLAPALLRLTGRAVFWPFVPQSSAPRRPAGRTLWDPLSRWIVARPGWILLGSLAAMLPFGWHGWSVDVTYDLLSELRPDRPSVLGTNLLRRYFPAGETGPITVLAFEPQGTFDATRPQLEKIARLAENLYRMEYEDSGRTTVYPVLSVRSLVEPLGEPPEKPGRFGLSAALRKSLVRGHHRTRSTYLASSPDYLGQVTRLDVVTRYDPFSLESILLLDRLDSYLAKLSTDTASEWHGTTFYFLGTTAGIRDLRLVTRSDLRLIQQLVPIAVLAVLVVILRRPLVSVYLVLSVLVGYFVSIGAVELYFSWLYGPTFQGLDWKVPMFLFVILIAVGEDYNIYLVTRVYEEQKRLGKVEGLRVALMQTGGIITSCGIIMAGTFASMTTGTLRAVSELGVALSFGVLLDTFVIRTVLVPAFLAIWDRWTVMGQRNTVRDHAGHDNP